MRVNPSVTSQLPPKSQGAEGVKDNAKSLTSVDDLKKLDANKDGKVDRTEFSNSGRYQSADERERDLLNRAFAAAANKAGQLDTDAAFDKLAASLAGGKTESSSIADGLSAAYESVKGFMGGIFGKMKKAASEFVSWASDQLNKVTKGFFEKFETNVVRRPEEPTVTAARSRLKETDADEQAALEKLLPKDREAYEGLATQLDSDPVSRLSLRNLLLEGHIPGGKDLADGKSLLSNLSTLSTQPLADGIDRKAMLADVLAHVADPICISQEQQNTCGPTTGQLMLALQEPAEYVRLAAGLASPEGSVRLQNGDDIGRKADWNDRADDERSIANRLFQSALMDYANGKFDYSNVKDARKVKVGPIQVDIPGLLPKEMVSLVEGLTGTLHDIDVSLMRGKVSPDFKAALSKAGPGNEVPILVNYSVDGNGLKNLAPHYMLVTGYDAKSDMVSVSNPWGREEKIALSELQKHLIASMPQA